jgi:hypothetical protein
MEERIEIPLYYVLGNKCGDTAKQVLSITPCYSSVISKGKDLVLAQELSEEVLWAESEVEDKARNHAILTGRPVLVIADSAELVAVYEDGRREILC